MKKIKIIIFSCSIFLLLISCSEDVLDVTPRHFIGPDNLFVDASGFDSGLNGLYALFRRERGGERSGTDNNDLLIDIAISGTDNAYGNHRSGWCRVGNEYDTRNIPEEAHNRNFFTYLYQVVGSANAIISRAEDPSIDWTLTEKNRVIGEARLFRAWAYRHLTFTYGDVPLSLVEVTGSTVRSDFTRTPVAEVRAQMLEDLLFAEANLPKTSSNPGKLVQGVATHYLAELYLTLDDYPNAITKASNLINGVNGSYSLIQSRYGVKSSAPGTPFTDMFLQGNSNKSEGNTEVLWVMQMERDMNGGGVNIMRRWFRNRSFQVRVNGSRGYFSFTDDAGGRGIGRVGPTQFALELYEESDHRGGRFAWRTYEVLNNPSNIPNGFALGDTIFFDYKNKMEPNNQASWPSTRKWDNAFNNDPQEPLNAVGEGYNDQVYLRLAETYLVLAEAQLKNNNPGGAATTINFLRRRANASLITAADVTVDFILDERSRELWSEEHRRYSLARNNKLVERYRLYARRYSSSIADKDKLMPIPQSVIDANTIPMEQNPGY
ncbi:MULTISPECIES: RagB/SusD family nutrient uptake outer membrane protein [unclassified Polaribacter]|uniref:RagB/SusD family nutrient uptake outer membrane protein n=1 Tax=unclassified Polaribacter TaxID=196858 RepID=UPI0011BDCF2C|nr:MULTISPECIES: RagB/SusD family nutrient uptake outer membrane protein [unclassified Polaribacter]TXD53145.1 RagB/SusD family nutrient uptake outer membrane protein [Polaribacter sp. IC063]TXD61265.1 RagB/SusD family nutrient uptake outer membrane protein [Polaribacter sp. IC066]